MKSTERLDQLYNEINQVILSRQHPVTGLLPASTAVNTHGDYTDAWVRDNVYSIIAPWSLSMAYKRQGNKERQDELEQATIKLMRGLLQSMMRQADKVETFKHTLAPLDALHAKYDTSSGLPIVADDAWGHLQIDATSIFLLMIAQMTQSGLRIIRTYDEVDFVQNLIYYISFAYRTPDYGIWERGNKINNGKTELNASSVGMAKAALQALDGLNLFGEHGSSKAVVNTIADAISLARNSLGALLPRESLSKEVDSAILSVIGFPAFAVSDRELLTKTRDEIIKKLGGNYGCKRFLWDGHQTSIEDPNRLYYEHSELADFEDIESEWPLFFAYLYINALFSDNLSTANFYRKKLESVMVDVNGVKLIPELFYLEKDKILPEKADPNSQTRIPNDNVPLVWAQSLYYTALLIDEQYIDTTDLDSVNLRGKTTHLRSAQVALVVLAENQEIKRKLTEQGVLSESIDDIAPYKVISAPCLVKAYSQVGANKALQLSGRPPRRLQSLASSETYEINHSKCLCLSWIQSEEDDYRVNDAELMSEKLKTEITHIRKHWLNYEAAVFTFLVTEKICQMPNASVLFETLKNLQLRTIDEKIGYASANLAYRASRQKSIHTPIHGINYLNESSPRTEIDNVFSELDQYALLNDKTPENYQHIIETYSDNKSEDALAQLEHIYWQAQKEGNWLIVRLCFALLNKKHSGLSDYLIVLSARHFSVITGAEKHEEFSLDPKLDNDQIIEALKTSVQNHVEHCLLQEVLSIIGSTQRMKPKLLEGLRSINLHSLLKLCLDDANAQWNSKNIIKLASESPSSILKKIKVILTSQHTIYSEGLKKFFPTSDFNRTNELSINTDWFEWRVERGLIVNLDRNFLEAIWESLAYTPSIAFSEANIKEHILDCDMIRSSMTSGEEMFAQLIDTHVQKIHPPYYKSAIIETLLAFTNFCKKNPEVHFENSLNLYEQLEKAATRYDENTASAFSSIRAIDSFLYESPSTLQQYLGEILAETAKAPNTHTA